MTPAQKALAEAAVVFALVYMLVVLVFFVFAASTGGMLGVVEAVVVPMAVSVVAAAVFGVRRRMRA